MSASTAHIPGGVEPGIRPWPYRLPATVRIGRVRLAVSNLQRSVAFYTDVIGLGVRSESSTPQGKLARLGVNGNPQVLLELEEIPGVQSIGQRARLGLYHTAFLLPSREALARFVRHLHTKSVPFGSSDHLYSEALYLIDPDGLSVEVYADRARDLWTIEGQELVTGVYPLNFRELLAVDNGAWSSAPAGTKVGHVHFYVGDLQQAKRFYHQALGLDIMTWRYPGALFTAAGGYHHHVGLNTWAAGSPVASRADARLLFWELLLPSKDDVQRAKASCQREGYSVGTQDGVTIVTDPWRLRVALIIEGQHRL